MKKYVIKMLKRSKQWHSASHRQLQLWPRAATKNDNQIAKLVLQAWRKQLRVGPAKIGSSAEGASTLARGVREHAHSGNFEILASLKCTFGAFFERINEKMNQSLQWELRVFSSKLTFVSVQ